MYDIGIKNEVKYYLEQMRKLMKKLFLYGMGFGVLLFGGEGQELFDAHCASCHSYYIPQTKLNANAKANNALLHLKAPALNELSFGVRLNVGDRKADEESQRMEVEDFITSYIESPDRNKSVIPHEQTSFYPNMPAMDGMLDEDQIEALSNFIFEYGEKTVIEHSAKTYSYDEALKIAADTGKTIMIRGVLPYCKWCIQMEREVMVEPEIKKIMEQEFVVVMMDVAIEKLPLGMKSLGTPSFYFISSDGKHIVDMMQGYGDKEEFLELLKTVKEEANSQKLKN